MIELKKASAMLMSTASLIAVGNLLVQQAATLGNKIASTQNKADALEGKSTVQTGANGLAKVDGNSGNTGDPNTVAADAAAAKSVADAGYTPFVPGSVPNPPD